MVCRILTFVWSFGALDAAVSPTSQKEVIFTYFRPQSRYSLYAWSPRVWVLLGPIGLYFRATAGPQAKVWYRDPGILLRTTIGSLCR